MTLPELTDNLNIIQSLADAPALTSSELKAKFDEAGNKIKEYINEILKKEYERDISELQNKYTQFTTDLNNLNTTVNENAGTLTQSQLDLMYPVGSIYMSANSTNPNNLFGGVWEQIKGRFLLGCGDNGDGWNYTANTTGGSPMHKHGSSTLVAGLNAFKAENRLYMDYATRSSQYIENQRTYIGSSDIDISEGRSEASPIGIAVYGDTDVATSLPPYLAVYIWKRTA